MHIRRDAITRARLQSRQTHRADPFFAAFAEYADRLCVRIDVSHVERSQFAQPQAAAVEQFHNGDIAQRHPNRRRLGFCLARWGGKKLFDLLACEDQRKFPLDFWQLYFAHGIVAQSLSSPKKLIKRAQR
jgi:hypothetical protein